MSGIHAGLNGRSNIAMRPRAKTNKTLIPTPKSTHTEDPFLREFLDPDFNVIHYFNTKLPTIQKDATNTQKSQPSRSPQPSAQIQPSPPPPIPLSKLVQESQQLVDQLNSHTTRLSTTLTQLTDDIIRKGSRLAYEVEVLRGEAMGLSDIVQDTLREDIAMFTNKKEDASLQGEGENREKELTDEEDAIRKLEVLSRVREKLETVIKTYGDAMDFPFPPSEVSVGSSFLSVSAPAPADSQSLEERGQAALTRLREEITTLLADEKDPIGGTERAADRVSQLKELCLVWKGTSEEKGRARFVDSLAKLVEARFAQLMKDANEVKSQGQDKPEKSPGTNSSTNNGNDLSLMGAAYAGGLLSRLNKIRSGL